MSATCACALYPHQHEGVEFLIRKRRALLGDDMGLGKTRQAIVALDRAVPEGMVLVVCPASLKLNWAREIRLVDPGAAIEVLGVKGHGHEAPRWVIVNYGLLAQRLGRPRFTWGRRDLISAGVTRERYIAALRSADARDYAVLIEFARS